MNVNAVAIEGVEKILLLLFWVNSSYEILQIDCPASVGITQFSTLWGT